MTAGLVFDPRCLLNIYTLLSNLCPSTTFHRYSSPVLTTRRSPTSTAVSLPITAELSKGGLTPKTQKPKVRSLLSISHRLPSKTSTDWRSRQPCRTLIEILDNDSFLKHIFLLPAGDLGRNRGRSFENPRRGGMEPRTMVVQYRLVQVCRRWRYSTHMFTRSGQYSLW
jgi:hypothetical protein